MKIPPLYHWSTPAAPQWAVPDLSDADLDALYETIVTFVGYDPRAGERESCIVLGSGFLVAVEETLVVISAAHIFSWWAEQIRPAAPHALRGLEGDKEDLSKRVRRVVEAGYIKALVEPVTSGPGCICSIVGMSFNANPRDMDIAVIQLSIPTDKDAGDFRILPIDADPFPFAEPVVIAGYTGGGRPLPADGEPFSVGLYERKLTVRAGHVGEYVKEPDGFRSPMLRVNIPSVPGMSGGPMILWRTTETDLGTHGMATAAGVISSSRLGIPFLLDHCHEGETWVSPIVSALCRSVHIEQKRLTLSDAIKQGRIPTFGYVASAVTWKKDPLTGHFIPSLKSKE